MSNTKCYWYLEDHDYTLWKSECGLSWQLSNDDTPKENQMNFCPKCGRVLIEELEE